MATRGFATARIAADGSVQMAFANDAALIDALKRAVPARYRSYDVQATFGPDDVNFDRNAVRRRIVSVFAAGAP